MSTVRPIELGETVFETAAAGLVVPFLPPQLSAEDVARARRQHVRREPWRPALGDEQLLIEPGPGAAVEPMLATTSIGLEIAGRPARLDLPAGLKAMLLAAIAPAAAHLELDPVIEGLLLERLLENPLRDLEPIVGPVHSTSVPAMDATAGSRRFSVRDRAGRSWPVRLLAEDSLLALVDRHWQARPAMRQPLPSLLVDVALRVGRTRLTLAQLRSLGVDDVVLPTAVPPARGHFLATIDERLVAMVKIADGRLVCSGRVATVAALPGDWHGLGEDLMDENDAPDSGSGLAALPIDLVFEVGRRQLPLAEVESIDAGYVIELDRPLSEAVEIRVKGQRIGRGELVMIQGRLGVRVTALSRGEDGTDA